MIAGVQKCGTTAMYRYLRRHPDVGMPRRKETHFFDHGGRNWTTPDYNIDLHELYEPDRAVYGESTPITSFWTPAHERIRAYNPDMSFILLFRDPVDRAFSQWCMERARGREPLSFDVAIRAGRARVKKRPQRYGYVERGFYAAQIEAMRAVFPRSRMLFLNSADLHNNHPATMGKVAEFIGVDPGRFQTRRIIARARKSGGEQSVLGQADRIYLRDLYAADLERFVRITNLDIGAWQTVSASADSIPGVL